MPDNVVDRTIGAVAALISGFRDAEAMLNKWLKKRKDQTLERGNKLRVALETGPRVVQQEYDSGYARFGQRFAQGDEIARSSMVQIIERMYNQLTRVLSTALAEPMVAVLDFDHLSNAATRANMDSSTVFVQLTQRLIGRAPIARNFSKSNQRNLDSLGAHHAMGLRDPSDILPVATWAPEPSQKNAHKAPARNAAFLSTSAPELATLCKDSPAMSPPVIDIDNVTSLAKALGRISVKLPLIEVTTSASTFKPALQKLPAHTVPSSEHDLTFSRLLRSDQVLARNMRELQSSIVQTSVGSLRVTSMGIHSDGSDSQRESCLPSSLRNEQPCASLPLASDQQCTVELTGNAYSTHRRQNRYDRQYDRTILDSSIHTGPKVTRVTPRIQVDDWACHSLVTTESQGFIGRAIDQELSFELDATGETNIKIRSDRRPSLPHKSLPQKEQLPVAWPASAIALQRQESVFCTTARKLQGGRLADNWQSQFTFPSHGVSFQCKLCGSRMSTKEFVAQSGSSRWNVSIRFVAKCHSPGPVESTASLSCVLCSQPHLFRGRNDLWAHLETHTVQELQADCDITPAGPAD